MGVQKTMPGQITAEKIGCILLRDQHGRPVGIVLRNGHWVFHEITEMGDEEIMHLFPGVKKTQ